MLGLVGGTGTVSTVTMLAVTLDGAAVMTPSATTMVFTAFVFIEFEKLHVTRWLRATPTVSDPWLALAVGGAALLQLAVLYTPISE